MMSKFIEVKKDLGNGNYNTHYVNVDHIVDIHMWSGNVNIVLSTGKTIDVIDTLETVLFKLNYLK